VLLPACGQRATTGGAQPESSKPLTIHLAYFPNVTHAVALVGTAKSMFAGAVGSNVTIDEQSFTAGPSEIEALFANAVDIGYIGPGPAINGYLKSKGKALRVIAGASSGGAGLVVRNGAGITDIKSLAGKRVAVPQTGGTQDISLRHALLSAGLNSTDKGGNVNVLPVAPADTLTLFIKGELDAAWVTEPWISRLVKDGHGALQIDERELWPGKKFATTVVIVRTAFMNEHPDVVDSFLRAHVETVNWIETHPDEAITVVGAKIKQVTGKSLPPDIMKSAFARTDFTYDPLRDTVNTFADWSNQLGYLHQDHTALGGFFDTGPLNRVLAADKRPPVP